MKKMKRFKKAAVMLMAAVMCFGVAGCKKTRGDPYGRCLCTFLFGDII